MKQYVYVDISTLANNASRNAVSPPILVTSGGNLEAPRAGCRIRVDGPCEIIYSKQGVIPGRGSPHVAVVTEAPVEIIEEYGK